MIRGKMKETHSR